jgi:DNA-binding transcriptional LysR family regulator
MDLKKLETLRSFATQGSLERTAAKRGLTLQAVSIQLKKLERELGAALFERRPNKMVLTDRGRDFLREINRAFDILERAKASLVEPSNEFTGDVSVSLAADIAGYFAPELAEFVRQHPKLHVKILARPSRESKVLVVDGEVDIGVGFFRRVPRSIVKRRICETGISLVFPRGHPLDRKEGITLQDVARYRVVLRRRSSATRHMIEAAFIASDVDLANILEVGRCQSVMNFVQLDLGVGLVHTICGRAEPNKKLRQVDMSRFFDPTDVALITRRNAIFGPAQKALMNTFVQSKAAKRLAQEYGHSPGLHRSDQNGT